MEGHNKNIVRELYKAISVHDTDRVHSLLAPNIDWWFHGPSAHKYNLMQLLTGNCVIDHMDTFRPLIVVGFGSIVVVEGYHIQENKKTCWMHVWTVENGKIMTEVREYLNTCVTISCMKKSRNVYLASPRSRKCKNVWQNVLADDAYMPHLLLAI